jgi:predicted esterase
MERKEIQKDGLNENIAGILSTIREETTLVNPERIILAGISQGCATGILALLAGRVRLGGFIGICGWIPFEDDITAIAAYSKETSARLAKIRSLYHAPENELMDEDTSITVVQTPIFLSHSNDDEVIPIRNGDKMQQVLRNLGFKITWVVYKDGGHWVNEPQGMDDMTAFIASCFQKEMKDLTAELAKTMI